jgi:hypothetical protein
VSAVLIGGNVTVRRESDRGGDFKRIPACRRARQIRCVVAYSAFRRKPPPNTRFGTPTGRFLSPRPGEGYEVLCTNPATLSGARGLLRPYYPSRRMPGPIGAVQPDPPAVRTPWASTPRAFRARCRTESAMSWLDVDHIGGPNDVRPQPTETLGPTWGLHLVDVNIVYRNLVELVRRQARTYLSR